VRLPLWNKTVFLAERVLGNVVSSGIKVSCWQSSSASAPESLASHGPVGGITVNSALALMLASLALFGLGLFGQGLQRAWFPALHNWEPERSPARHSPPPGCVAGGAVTVSAARVATSLVKRDDSPSPPPGASASAGGPATPPPGRRAGASVALAEAEEIEPQWRAI